MTLHSFLASALVLLLYVGNVFGLEEDHRQLQQGDNTVLAEAFLCDDDFIKISSDKVVNKGDSIRICIKTHVRAKVQGISIAKVIDFFLLKEFEDAGDMEQILLQGGVVATASEELSCEPGSELCVLESVPMNDFFGRDGKVSAIGSVLLQYDNDNSSGNNVRTAIPTVAVTSAPTRAPTALPSRAPTSAPQNETETLAPTSSSQENQTEPVTPQNAKRQLLDDSRAIVETSFTVVTAGSGTGFLSDFREHWDSSPTYIKVLYVFAFIFVFLILSGLGLGLLLWAGFCGNTMELRERFHPLLSSLETDTPAGKTNRDDHTMDESMGAFSPTFARNKEEDRYDDEPETMPKQIAFKRPFSSSGRTDIEAPGGGSDAVAGRKRKPRNPAAKRAVGRKSARERNSAHKARMTRNSGRQTVNPNRDLAASFLNKFPKQKVASVRSKTPRSVHERNRPPVGGNVVGDIPREKTASGIRWLREKDQLQQSTHSVNSTSQRGVNQQQLQGYSHVSGLAPRRGGIALHGQPIPKSSQRPTTPNPSQRRTTKPPTNPLHKRSIPQTIPEKEPCDDIFEELIPQTVPDDESCDDNFDVESPPPDKSDDIPHGIDNPRPID